MLSSISINEEWEADLSSDHVGNYRGDKLCTEPYESSRAVFFTHLLNSITILQLKIYKQFGGHGSFRN